jgi:hypothetical protein
MNVLYTPPLKDASQSSFVYAGKIKVRYFLNSGFYTCYWVMGVNHSTARDRIFFLLLLFIYSLASGEPILLFILSFFLLVDSTQILYNTHTEHTQTSMPKSDSNPLAVGIRHVCGLRPCSLFIIYYRKNARSVIDTLVFTTAHITKFT